MPKRANLKVNMAETAASLLVCILTMAFTTVFKEQISGWGLVNASRAVNLACILALGFLPAGGRRERAMHILVPVFQAVSVLLLFLAK